MPNKSVLALSSKTNTFAAVKLSLLATTIIATATPAFANESKPAEQLAFNIETVGELIESIITVRSSDGGRWDAVSEGQYTVKISGSTDAETLGVVNAAGLFAGHCITNQCSTHQAMWSAVPGQPIVSFELDVNFTSENLLTVQNGEAISPASWLGEQMIAECNARLGEDGPTVDYTIPVSLPFSLTMNTEDAGDVRRTSTANFLLNCVAYDGDVADLEIDEEISVASIEDSGSVWTGDSSTEIPGGYSGEPIIEEDAGLFPENDEEGEGSDELDLGNLFPFPIPLPPLDPEVPAVPEEPIDPEVNPSLGEMPDGLATPDGGVGPDPGPDPEGPILVLPLPQPPVDPKVNPNLGEMPTDLTVGPNPTHSDKKDKAEKKAIRDALKKKKEAKRKKKAKQKQAILDRQRKKQEAKKKRKAEKKALRKALKKKAKNKKKKIAKRVNPKPAKKKVVVKKKNGKKVVKVKTKKPSAKKIRKVKKTKIKVAPAPKKKRALKVNKRLKKQRKS